MITIDEFKKIEIRAGKILTAEVIEGSEKLLKLSVDFGSAADESFGETKQENIKQVVSGIAKFITPEELVGQNCAFVTNLEPREIMGLKSEAMIMALSGDGYFSLLQVSENVPCGSIVK